MEPETTDFAGGILFVLCARPDSVAARAGPVFETVLKVFDHEIPENQASNNSLYYGRTTIFPGTESQETCATKQEVLENAANKAVRAAVVDKIIDPVEFLPGFGIWGVRGRHRDAQRPFDRGGIRAEELPGHKR